MIIKEVDKETFYKFDSEKFSFLKENKNKNYSGDLFIISNNKYVLFNDTVLQSNTFRINIKDYSFEYKESYFLCYLIIKNSEQKIKIKKMKSLWEFLNISTYDYLDKIDDNKLFFLFNKIKDIKTALVPRSR